MSTFTQLTLNTTLNGTSAQLPTTTSTGWSSSASVLTLSPSSASTPAIYGARLNAPTGYTYTGSGNSFSFGSNGAAVYAVMVASGVTDAYVIACNDIESTAANQALTLSLSNGTSTASLVTTVQFSVPS